MYDTSSSSRPPCVSSRYKFTGKERDAESGLDYFGARYYGSMMGRWTSPDWAAKPEAVPYSSLSNPQTLNLYAYVGNNPLNHTDPDGHRLDRWNFYEDLIGQYQRVIHDSSMGASAAGAASEAAYSGMVEAQQNGDTPSTNPSPDKKPTKKPNRGGRRRTPHTDKPPIPLPAGPKGQPNKWIPIPGSQDRDYGPRFGPEFPIPGDKNGSQPNAWWDPDDGYWSYEPGNGGPRGHYDEWGNKISKMAILGAEIVTAIKIITILNDVDEATGP